jgi:replicative DNA helicase
MAELVDERAQQRTLPHNLDAECSVLGAVLIENSVWPEVALVLVATDFFRAAHQRIFEGIVTLMNTVHAADLVMLREELERTGDLDEVGGASYIAALVDGVPRSTNVVYYAAIVKEKATLRAAIRSANMTLGLAYEAEQPSALVLEMGVQSLLSLADHGATGEKSLDTALQDYSNSLIAEKSAIIPTGLVDLDSMVGGFQRKRLSVVAARPSVGKTSLMLSVVDNVTARDDAAAMITLEMEAEDLAGNLVAAHSGVSSDRLRRGQAGDQQWAKITQAFGTLAGRKLYFIERVRSLTQIAAWARRLRDTYGVRLLVLDYMQRLGNPDAKDRQQEVAMLSRGLKQLAQDEDIAVVAISSLGRDPEKRQDKRPHLSDLRESGAIEFDADLVLLLFREEMYKPDDEALHGIAEIIIAKNRGGPVGTVKVVFIRDTARWANLALGYGV